MRKKFLSSFTYLIGITITSLIIGFSVQLALAAWQEPTAAPPGDNVPAPINVGPDGQVKIGGLKINTGSVSYTPAPVGFVVATGTMGIGIGTTADPEFKLDIDNDGGIIARGAFGSGANLTTAGAGTRLIWYPKKAAFRAGKIGGLPDKTQWDNANIGDYSVAFGLNTKAYGRASFAIGEETSANDSYSVAMGYQTTASNGGFVAGMTSSANGAIALGSYANASGDGGIALGNDVQASAGKGSVALGFNSIAQGGGIIPAIAIGSGAKAIDDMSFALGKYVTADTSLVLGSNAMVFGAGIDDSNRLFNNIPNSLMIGFDSTIPTLFVGPSSGAGTTGSVGIATTTPASNLKLAIAGRVGATEYCDENGNNCTLAANLGGGGSGLWTAGTGNDIYKTTNGNVGIGTTTPGAALDLDTGGIRVFGDIKTDAQTDTATFLGVGAGANNTVSGIIDEGTNNTFIGYLAGNQNTTGFENTFIGEDAGENNTIGTHNTFVGDDAGKMGTSSYQNTFIGNDSGYYNVSGVKNVFTGYRSGYKNISGKHNSFLGYYAGAYNTQGDDNSFFGYLSGNKTDDGSGNSFFGTEAGRNNINGKYNTYIGKRAGYNTVGDNNIFLGYNAGYNELGSNKLYIANSSTNPPLIYGDFSTGRIGLGTTTPLSKLNIDGGGLLITGATGTTPVSGAGTRLMWIPSKAAFRAGEISPGGTMWNESNIGNNGSVAMGFNPLASGETAIALGWSPSAKGNWSVAIGHSAYTETTADHSLAFGYNARANGAYATALGRSAQANGINSTAIGYQTETNGIYAFIIGKGIGGGSKLINNINNSLMIGFNSDIPTLFVGPSAGTSTTGNVGIGTTNPQETLEINSAVGTTRLRITDINQNAEIQLQYGPNSANDHWAVYNNQADDSLNIWSYNSGSAGNRLTIAQNGQIIFGNGINSYTFPVTRGSSGEILKIDANGNLLWQADGGNITSADLDSAFCSTVGKIIKRGSSGWACADDNVGGLVNGGTGTDSAIVGGSGHTLTGNNSIVLGGTGHTLSGSNSIMAGGSNNQVSGDNVFAFGQDIINTGGTFNFLLGKSINTTGSNLFVWDPSGLSASISNSDSFIVYSKTGINTISPQSALQVKGYTQIDSAAGAPSSTDCSSDGQRGRMIIDYTNNKLYICNGAIRGWDYIDLLN